MRAESVVGAHLRFLELCGQRPGSVYMRRRALARMSAVLPGPLAEASAADLAAWREGLTVGPASVVSYVSHASGFYTWAAMVGLRDDNPAEGLPVPRLHRRLPRPIGEEDLAAAIAGAPERIRPWLVLAGWAGLRAQEIAYLRRESVLDGRRPRLLLVTSDAAKGGTERAVPMCSYVHGELCAAGMPRQGWMFRRRDGRPGPNRPWLVSKMSNDYLHEAGIRATLHQLRHRFGTQTYAARRDLRMVQELLGHASPSATAGYAAFDQGDAVAVVEELPVPGQLRAVGQ